MREGWSDRRGKTKYSLIMLVGLTTPDNCRFVDNGCETALADSGPANWWSRWAIKAHIQGLREDGLRVPRPRTLVEQIEVG
jgi:hypothetical protein